jgi:uncharacterized protein
MRKRVILDAGPLVALVHRDDQFHAWAREQATHLKPLVLSCEAVLSEASFLLRGIPNAQAAMLGMLLDGMIQVVFQFEPEKSRIVE